VVKYLKMNMNKH